VHEPGSLYLGLISGTSADGIDAALVSFEDDTPRMLGGLTHPWPDSLRQELLAVAQGEIAIDLDRLGRLDVALAACFADAAQRLLLETGVPAQAVAAIGSHGQTMRHRPGGNHPFTMQLGDPSVIAERCGISVVADFRRADVAAGGQGAPLLPPCMRCCWPRSGAAAWCSISAASPKSRCWRRMAGLRALTRGRRTA
jgi:anhydro-N-acetylmuramic acid kinase